MLMGHLKKDLEEMEELALRLAEEVIFQAEGTANPTALRWEHPRCVCVTMKQVRTRGRVVSLEEPEHRAPSRSFVGFGASIERF